MIERCNAVLYHERKLSSSHQDHHDSSWLSDEHFRVILRDRSKPKQRAVTRQQCETFFFLKLIFLRVYIPWSPSPRKLWFESDQISNSFRLFWVSWTFVSVSFSEPKKSISLSQARFLSWPFIDNYISQTLNVTRRRASDLLSVCIWHDELSSSHDQGINWFHCGNTEVLDFRHTSCLKDVSSTLQFSPVPCSESCERVGVLKSWAQSFFIVSSSKGALLIIVTSFEQFINWRFNLLLDSQFDFILLTRRTRFVIVVEGNSGF